MRRVSPGVAGAVLVVLLAAGPAFAETIQLAALDAGTASGRAGSQDLPWTPVVRDVQRALRDLGYYKGPVDGRLNSATEKAIRKYRFDHGIGGTALATPDLLTHLESLRQSSKIDRNLDRARQEQTALAREALRRNTETRDLLGPATDTGAPPPGHSDSCFRNPTVHCLLAEALAIANAVQRADYRQWALRDIIRVQAEVGGYAAARGSIRRLDDPRLMLVALREVVEALAVSGRVDEATELAETIPDLSNRTKALAVVAGAEAARGRFEAAHGLGDRVLDLMKTDFDLVSRVEVATGIAIQFDAAGDHAGALAMMQRAREIAVDVEAGAMRDAAFGALARAYSEMGQADEVLQILGGTNSGRPVVAAATASSSNATRYRVLALSDIAVAQFRLGAVETAQDTLEAALSSAETIKAAFPKDYALARIAASQARMGGEGIATALRIKNPAVRTRCLWSIAAIQREAGDETRATETAARAAEETAKLPNAFERVLVLAERSSDHALAGRLDRARAFLGEALPAVRSIRTDWWRARALAAIAGALHAVEGAAKNPRTVTAVPAVDGN